MHLQAIDAALALQTPQAEIVRKVFLTFPTHAFVGLEDRQYDILDRIARFFLVPIHSIQVTGSAKIGHSLHKRTPFELGRSDLDVAIIDASLFADYLERGLGVSRTDFPRRNGVSVFDEYNRNLARGVFRPDLMPNGRSRGTWNAFFDQLSTENSDLFSSVSAGVYLSQHCFECKQKSSIQAHIDAGAPL